MNIFIHHRDLRIKDNTTLIKQNKKEGNITPIFIFPPEQIEEKKNPYFSHNLVQFMVESLKDLQKQYDEKDGQLYFFKGKYIEVLSEIHKKEKINSIGFNTDYSPYAKKRDIEIIKWARLNHVEIYEDEDILLEPIKSDKGLNKSGDPYRVFTPFKNNLKKKHKVKKVDNYNKFNVEKSRNIKKVKYYFTKLDTLYKKNDNLLVKGGRKWALKRLNDIKEFDEYDKCRDYMSYQTTLLSASINFNVISIRELYWKIRDEFKESHGLINELYWRDFYYNILYYFPHVIGNNYNKDFDKIKWSRSKKNFKKWCDGETGYPMVDACMKQLNCTGYMHNRGRMIVSSFLIKHLWIDWRWGEKYFANKLVDYNMSANNGGWQWSSGGGVDSQPYFRIFNPWTQIEKYDKEGKYKKNGYQN
jgi:deoxyribodipyrimidine photo-lyase